MDAIEIPAPTHRLVIEAEQALLVERTQKLNHKERIAGCLLIYELHQRPDVCRIASKRAGEQLPEVITRQPREADFMHLRSGLADGIERARQRMGGIDLVIAIGPDQHQILELRTDQQIIEQVERRLV